MHQTRLKNALVLKLVSLLQYITGILDCQVLSNEQSDGIGNHNTARVFLVNHFWVVHNNSPLNV